MMWLVPLQLDNKLMLKLDFTIDDKSIYRTYVDNIANVMNINHVSHNFYSILCYVFFFPLFFIVILLGEKKKE